MAHNNGNGNGKALRFAALVRVSTEKQEQQGESLNLQRKNNLRDVERSGGHIVKWSRGQEHATEGWERAKVDRLIADAAKGKFDAVIVAYPDRWSRDNAKSKEGLNAFRHHGIRFYVGTVTKNLHDPNVRLELGMQAEIGEFVALQQAEKIAGEQDRAGASGQAGLWRQTVWSQVGCQGWRVGNRSASSSDGPGRGKPAAPGRTSWQAGCRVWRLKLEPLENTAAPLWRRVGAILSLQDPRH